MCGIIGCVGKSDVTPIIMDGLKRLEYRGYDSAGIAVLGPNGVEIERVEGKLVGLEKLLLEKPLHGSTGIGHTRWATHGRPSETNAHPHRSGDTIVVHNGIIENYIELKKFLTGKGFEFSSETDTEVVCHLVEYFCRKGDSTFKALLHLRDELKGSYALVVMNARESDVIYAAKRGSPLVIGQGKNENLVASDIPALLPYTREMIFMEDGDFAIIKRSGIELYNEDGEKIERTPQHIPWNELMAERGGYKHFMQKEIFEQPNVVRDVLLGRIAKDHSEITFEYVNGLFDGTKPLFDRISIIACGTSYHAGLVGKYLIESLARIPVSVDLASEYRYREPLIDKRTLLIPISQSGETADTLAAETMAREMGARIIAICNVVGSSITRVANGVIYTNAGPEIGVASTKAFTAQLMALYLFSIFLADKSGKIDRAAIAGHIDEIMKVPRFLKEVLGDAKHIQKIAEDIADASHVLFIGRGANYPVALEGALKLKEISYMHAEGFAAGELKHGPIALIDQGVPVVAIAPNDSLRSKILSNVEEVKARGASVISVINDGDKEFEERSKHTIKIPKANWCVTPILATVPLQLLAYYVADHKGTDVDQPRNLAKSVTVE